MCGARRDFSKIAELFRQMARWAGIENTWFKLLKFVGVSGWGQNITFLARPSHTKSNIA